MRRAESVATSLFSHTANDGKMMDGINFPPSGRLKFLKCQSARDSRYSRNATPSCLVRLSFNRVCAAFTSSAFSVRSALR